MKTPQEGAPREVIRSVRLGPTDVASFERRRRERGETPSGYLRSLVREDAAAHPEVKRGNPRTQS